MLASVTLLVTPAFSQDTAELEAKIEALAAELEALQLQDAIPVIGSSAHGLGSAASKVYSKEQGFSIGGYGEGRYRQLEAGDEFDWYRHVMYFGYKFNDQWVLNTEIEIEHAEEVFVEFAYIDYLGLTENMNLRTGLMLSPMGLLNEYHEPTTFLTANRSQTETVILPTTWRENGVGVFGEKDGVDYKVYILNGLDGESFGDTNSSLRGGRQKGAKAVAEDWAFVASANYVDIPGFRIGASIYSGDSGQGGALGDMSTDIVELHAEYKSGPWWARAMIADAEVTDRLDDPSTALVEGDMELTGTYYELGYDLLSERDASLYPYVRYEEVETTGGDDELTTLGLHYRPIDQLCFKLDQTTNSADEESCSFVIGYVF